MKLSKIFPFLYRKDKALYPLFINQATVVENAAKLLVNLLKAESYDERNELCKQIKACESQGDSIATQIFETLYKTKRITFKEIESSDLSSLGGPYGVSL